MEQSDKFSDKFKVHPSELKSIVFYLDLNTEIRPVRLHEYIANFASDILLEELHMEASDSISKYMNNYQYEDSLFLNLVDLDEEQKVFVIKDLVSHVGRLDQIQIRTEGSAEKIMNFPKKYFLYLLDRIQSAAEEGLEDTDGWLIIDSLIAGWQNQFEIIKVHIRSDNIEIWPPVEVVADYLN